MRVACRNGHEWHTETVNVICPVCHVPAGRMICESETPYSFPRTRFVAGGNVWKQYRHLVSEVLEVGIALLFRDYAHASRELWDVCQSSETGNHMLQDQGVDTCKERQAVVAGNYRRGYYVDVDK